MSYNVKIFFNSFKCNSLNISTQEIYDLDHFHNYGNKYNRADSLIYMSPPTRPVWLQRPIIIIIIFNEVKLVYAGLIKEWTLF